MLFAVSRLHVASEWHHVVSRGNLHVGRHRTRAARASDIQPAACIRDRDVYRWLWSVLLPLRWREGVRLYFGGEVAEATVAFEASLAADPGRSGRIAARRWGDWTASPTHPLA